MSDLKLMQKSLFTKDYSLFLEHLRRAREATRLTQDQLAKKLATTQSFVSKCERGERRLDIVEVRAWCRALGTPFTAFVAKFDKSLGKSGGD
jgi:transcriptional regulator with XRE-family HTH domain